MVSTGGRARRAARIHLGPGPVGLLVPGSGPQLRPQNPFHLTIFYPKKEDFWEFLKVPMYCCNIFAND